MNIFNCGFEFQTGPEEGIWDWSGKILWSRPVARNLLGFFEENVDLILIGSGAAEEYIWCVHCPHS